jgi:hypothetical protein
VSTIATNEVQAIRNAEGDAKAQQKAYDKYVERMTAEGQTKDIKTLNELRG